MNKAKIILIEDDLNLGFVIKDQLESNGYEVDWSTNGEDGLKRCLNGVYQLAILDVMLPQKSGFDVAEDLVESKPELPFMFLTAKSMLGDKLKGLKLGEDYLCKPFEMDELLQRISNIFDRNNELPKSKESEKIIKLGDYEFDYTNQYLIFNEEIQKLTKREADLLRLLYLSVNQVMNRDLALKSIWGNDDYFNGRSMDVFISRLRKYLKKDDKIQIINVHGVGFKLAIRA